MAVEFKLVCGMNFQIDSLSLSALRSELLQDTPCELPLTVLHVFGMSVWSTMTLQWLTTLMVGDQAITWSHGNSWDRSMIDHAH